MRIGELARLSGLTPDTLRYYERRGLLEKPHRSSGRFRIYSAATIERVRFIKRAQALGFSLDDIGQLVRFNGRGGLGRCRRVRDLLEGRLSDLAVTPAELQTLQASLATALEQCERAIRTGNESACPVIDLSTGAKRAT